MDAIHPPPPPAAIIDKDRGAADLTALDPAYVKVLRIQLVLLLLPVLIGALLIESAGLPVPGTLFVPVALIAAYLALSLPKRRYRSRGYDLSADRLRVVKGVLFHVDTTVPFGRVQHLDVEQGPLERLYGLATLKLHTAGTHNASVSLQGLAHEGALGMREAIRAHVRRETM